MVHDICGPPLFEILISFKMSIMPFLLLMALILISKFGILFKMVSGGNGGYKGTGAAEMVEK